MAEAAQFIHHNFEDPATLEGSAQERLPAFRRRSFSNPVDRTWILGRWSK